MAKIIQFPMDRVSARPECIPKESEASPNAEQALLDELNALAGTLNMLQQRVKELKKQVIG